MNDIQLTAIDPLGCGCTECLIGEYRPLGEATEDDLRRLFPGELRDNTETWWSIQQNSTFASDGFTVSAAGVRAQVQRIALPIPVELYELTISAEVVAQMSGADLFIGV